MGSAAHLTATSRRAGEGRGGFTLVEVMVALAILGIEALALMTLLVSCQGLESVTHETALAVNEARRVLEGIRYREYAQIDETNVAPTFDVSQGGMTLTPQAGQAQCGSVSITEDAGAGVKDITVVVSWRSITGGNRRIQLACQVSDHL